MPRFERGVAQAEVARALEVSRQTVSAWNKALAEDAQAWRRRPLRRPGALSAADNNKLAKLLVAGTIGAGFPIDLRSLGRIRQLIEREYGLRTSHVYCLQREIGFSSQWPIAVPW